MARKKREVSADGRYHVLLRGINSLFEDESDYDEFLRILKKYADEKQYTLVAYLLAENRVHLILDTNGGDIGGAVKPVCTSYARSYNRNHGETGKIFYDRFKSEPINSAEQLKNAVAFLNFTAVCKDCKYCSMYSDLCDVSEMPMEEEDFRSLNVTEMFIEDYDCFSEDELGKYIYELCGVYPHEFKDMEAGRRDELFEQLMHKRWISREKLRRLLGIGRVHAKTKTHEEDKPARGNDLSVWLL